MELGERTAKMEKAQGERNDLEHSNDIVTKSKEHQLADIGISKMQASRFEQLVKPENRPIVERYLAVVNISVHQMDGCFGGRCGFSLTLLQI